MNGDWMDTELKMSGRNNRRTVDRINFGAIIVVFSIGIVVGMAIKALENKFGHHSQIKCIACHNVRLSPPAQFLTGKAYKEFYNKLMRES